MKNLLSIEELSREEIEAILDRAESFAEVGRRDIKKVPTLRGRTVVTDCGSLLFSMIIKVPQEGHKTFLSRCSAKTRRYSPHWQRMSCAPAGAFRRRVVRPSDFAAM